MLRPAGCLTCSVISHHRNHFYHLHYTPFQLLIQCFYYWDSSSHISTVQFTCHHPLVSLHLRVSQDLSVILSTPFFWPLNSKQFLSKISEDYIISTFNSFLVLGGGAPTLIILIGPSAFMEGKIWVLKLENGKYET